MDMTKFDTNLVFTAKKALPEFLSDIEKQIILDALEKTQWNRTRAAELLGITFRAMRYRMANLEIEGRAPEKRRPRLNASLWQKLRFATLLKHNGRCAICGVTAKQGYEMHVDHIKPVSKFPELAMQEENLQVLCQSCNARKGTKLINAGYNYQA